METRSTRFSLLDTAAERSRLYYDARDSEVSSAATKMPKYRGIGQLYRRMKLYLSCLFTIVFISSVTQPAAAEMVSGSRYQTVSLRSAVPRSKVFPMPRPTSPVSKLFRSVYTSNPAMTSSRFFLFVFIFFSYFRNFFFRYQTQYTLNTCIIRRTLYCNFRIFLFDIS